MCASVSGNRLGYGRIFEGIGSIGMIDLKWRTAFCFGIGLSLLMTACGGGGGGNTTTPPTTTYTLTVNSTNPTTGVAITVSPADINSAANGSTSFTRTYDAGASVTLTAPATSGSDTFASWTGCTSTSGATCTVTLNANTTVTANYAVPATTYTLTVNSTNPATGVAITVSPADINSAANGSTSFTRTYDAGASVTLTAPATFRQRHLHLVDRMHKHQRHDLHGDPERQYDRYGQLHRSSDHLHADRESCIHVFMCSCVHVFMHECIHVFMHSCVHA